MVIHVKDTVSGAFGAFCCVYSGNPFDVAKVRLQTQHSHISGFAGSGAAVNIPDAHKFYNGPIHCLRSIIKTEGILTLWRGSTAALGSALIENSVLFTANGALRRVFLKLHHKDYDSHDRPNDNSLSLLDMASIGGLSGVFSSTCITPAEMVKCRLQTQRKVLQTSTSSKDRVYQGPMDVVKSTLREEGVRGLFRGLSATMTRDVPFSFFFFGSYETWCHLLGKWKGTSTKSDLGPFSVFLAGGLAGVSAWSIIFPIDLVKSRMQTATKAESLNLRQTFRSVYHEGGIAGFYRGWSSAVMRAFPANAALFLGYETMSELFHLLEKNNA